MPPVNPVLCMTVTEPDKAPMMFHIERLAPAAEGGLDFHGYFTDRIALDGNIVYRPDLDGLEVTMQILNVSNDMNARFGTTLELTGEAEPRWMIPGLFYRDNKPEGCTRAYPTFHEFTRDPRQFISSHWSFRADRAATPLVCAWTYGCFAFFYTAECFGVTPDHPEGAGMASLVLAQEDGSPRLGAEFPYRESPVKYSFCQDDGAEAEETFLHLPKRVPLLVNFVVGFGVPDLHAYDKVLRAIYTKSGRFHQIRGRTSSEEAERNAHMGLLRWHYDQKNSVVYESSAFDKHFGKRGTHFDKTHMHAGGVGGALPAFVLLWGGREADHDVSIEAGVSIFNKLTSALSPAGTIFPVWTEEFGWSCSYGPEEGTAHSRTLAEAILFIIRAVRLELKHNQARGNWLEAAASTLTYAMAAQRPDGAFPSYFDLTTGRPTSYEGFAGAAWIAALVAGSTLLYQPHFRESATLAANYYMKMLQEEFLFGSVEEEPYVPTADDAHWAVISYLMLYEFDRDAKWLAMAKKAADLALTWRFTYNVTFSKYTMAGMMGMKTRGGCVSSVASPVTNASGLICYGEMLKLAALTGDKHYKDRADDTRLFATQLIAREDGDLNGRIGMTAGHVCHTDWTQPKGHVMSLSQSYACALVRYAELVRRSLDIPLSVFAGQEESELAIELGSAPVLYSEVTLSTERPVLDAPRLPSFAGFSRFEGLAGPMSAQPAFSQPTPIPVPKAPSADAIPRFPSGASDVSPFGGGSPDGESKPQNPDDEIKYKIF